MVTEIELKYSLLESHDLATIQQVQAKICQLLTQNNLVFEHQKKQLSNHYFDTPNLALRHQKIALRTRGTQLDVGDVIFEQTIKTSGTVIAGLHQRPEYNVDISNDKPILSLFPKSIWQAEADIKKLQQQVIELFSTNFTRHTWLVTVGDAQVEIAFDSGEVACQGYEHKPNIYEIELELVNGDAKSLFLLAKLLFSQLALRLGQLTKAARGYALYHESQSQSQSQSQGQGQDKITRYYDNDSSKTKLSKSNSIEQVSIEMISLSKQKNLIEAFKQGVDYSLTQLQLCIDSYVEVPSLKKLSKISELLALLRQGFWLFSEFLTDDQLKMRSELSYFIRTIHWVDNAQYIQALNNKQSSYQKEVMVSQDLIQKLQLTDNRYPNEEQVISLLHSERFNKLQLSLLSFLLESQSAIEVEEVAEKSLSVFAATQLSKNTLALNNELEKLQISEYFSTGERYFTAHSLLIRALLTTSWFSYLFVEPDNELAKKFNMPWLDIKEGISELQSLHLLQQQLAHLPDPEIKLASWLADKSENLITALDHSRAKALSMKPYWP